MRKMAHVEIISDLQSIEGADRIEVATVLGWKVVVKKNEYEVGDRIVYVEIDAWVPHDVAPFLTQGAKPRTYNDVEGERLRTIRLRGQISQGLILPLPITHVDAGVGDDMTEVFGIQKWEKSVDASLSGVVRGNYPVGVPKTDQERIQSNFHIIKKMIERDEIKDEWIVQEKLEGSSMQVAKSGDEYHVMSRNLSLKLDQEGNTFVDVAKRDRLIELLQASASDCNVISLQGELIGPGIQGNIYKLKQHEFRLFDIWYEDSHMTVAEIAQFIRGAKEFGFDIDMVPIERTVVTDLFSDDSSVDAILELANIKSALNADQDAEGLVFKNMENPNVTFKAISNNYLIKHQ